MTLATSPTAVIIAEAVSPGFAEDLSTWVFAVESDGAATQQAVVSNVDNLFCGEQRIFVTQIARAEVMRLLALAVQGRFGRLAPNYSPNDEHRCVTDLPKTALSFRIDDELKRVEVYGAGFLAYEGSEEMKLYCDLWENVERHLPFGGA